MVLTLHSCLRDPHPDAALLDNRYLWSTERIENALAVNLGCKSTRYV
jgi:hypothetical protein